MSQGEEKPLYRFEGLCVVGPNNADRPTPWDKGKQLSVLASNRTEAVDKALAMLGPTGSEHLGWGQSWKVRFDRIEEVLRD